jgi:uncharacterized spore protein YtfJ
VGIEELVKTVLSELRKVSKTETVIGEPMVLGEATIVPVTKISFGFGIGGGAKGAKEGHGEATGGGASVEPVAFFVVRGDKVDLITIKKDGVGLGKVIDLVPQIFEKVKGYKSKQGKASSAKKEKKQ